MKLYPSSYRNYNGPTAVCATLEPEPDDKPGSKKEELQSWENEGGEVPAVPIPDKEK